MVGLAALTAPLSQRARDQRRLTWTSAHSKTKWVAMWTAPEFHGPNVSKWSTSLGFLRKQRNSNGNRHLASKTTVGKRPDGANCSDGCEDVRTPKLKKILTQGLHFEWNCCSRTSDGADGSGGETCSNTVGQRLVLRVKKCFAALVQRHLTNACRQ